MQFSVMNLSGFDFYIVSIYDWKTCIKWKQWKHYVWTFNKGNTQHSPQISFQTFNLGINIILIQISDVEMELSPSFSAKHK
jgi:hypothetical protein